MNVPSTHAWCPTCSEQSAIDREGRCLWCGGETTPEQPTKLGKPFGVHGKLKDEHLIVLHRHHEAGVSVRELGRQIWERMGFSSANSAAAAISTGFKRLGLAIQDRSAATAAANVKRRAPDSPGTANREAYKRWLREKRGGRRQCKGVRTQYPRKGERCQRYASPGSDYCRNHDPERRDEVLRIVTEARQRIETKESACP